MRKIRIFAHISLDGVISPGGPNENSDYANGGWTAPYRTPAGEAAVDEPLADAEVTSLQARGKVIIVLGLSLDEQLGAFQYVNGKLFEETLPMASFDAKMRRALLDCCYMDWSKISAKLL